MRGGTKIFINLLVFISSKSLDIYTYLNDRFFILLVKIRMLLLDIDDF